MGRIGREVASSPITGKGRRILIVASQVPGHDLGVQNSGHAQYLNGFLDHFRSIGFDVSMIVLRPNVDFVCRSAIGLKVTVMGPSFRRIGRWVFLSSPRGIVRLVAWKGFVRLPRFVQAAADRLRLALRKNRGYVHRLGRFPSAAEIAYVRGMATKFNPDIVIYDGIFTSCGRLNAAQHWVITHDVKHERAASFKENGVRISPTTFDENTERAILEDAGNVIAVQWDDAREFERLTPSSRVLIVPNTMPLPKDVHHGGQQAGRCLFVGSGSFHNYHGIRWFLDECWPKIRAVVPGATLDVVGSVCFRLSDAPAGVTLRGVVKDLDAVYNSATVTVVPLQIGSGLKVKVHEAIVREQAIVTTSIGAQGLMHFSPLPFVIADSSADFAAQTAALLTSSEREGKLRADAAQCASLFDPQVAFVALDAAMAGDPTRV